MIFDFFFCLHCLIQSVPPTNSKPDWEALLALHFITSLCSFVMETWGRYGNSSDKDSHDHLKSPGTCPDVQDES